jgi:hypothetical protein
MKAYGGMEVYLHAFFDLGTRWRWVFSFTPPPLYSQGKSPRYPLDKRLGGLQSRSGHCDEQKNSSPRRESKPDRPARSQSLYRLSYHGSWYRLSGIRQAEKVLQLTKIFAGGGEYPKTGRTDSVVFDKLRRYCSSPKYLRVGVNIQKLDVG